MPKEHYGASIGGKLMAGADKHKANLRLDIRANAIKPAKSGDIAIVPGKAEQSALVRRIISSDPDEHMPPEDSHKKLTAAQIEILRRWVGEGAEYATHWAFMPPVRPGTRTTSPSFTSSAVASRIVSRLTSYWVINCCSVGSRSPGRRAPLRI